MKNAYLLLTPFDQVSLIETNAESFDLDHLREEVQCDMIEIVRVQDPTGKIQGRLLLIIDDEGHFRGKKANLHASRLYGTYYAGIVGTALVCKEGIVNGEPDCIPLTREEAANLLQVMEGES